MNGSRVATLVFGVCLCTTITVTTFQLQHKVNSYMNMGSRVYSSPNSDPIIAAAVLPQNNVFAKGGTQKLLTRHDIDFEQLLQQVGSETRQYYSLASTLVSIQHTPPFSFTTLGTNELTILLFHLEQQRRQNVTHDVQIEHMHIKNIGHRGSPYTALENTGRSFLHAAQAGADGVELDVFLLKCGTLVVFHGSGDDTNPGLLDSYCGVEGSM